MESMDSLPVEMLEVVLLGTFVNMFAENNKQCTCRAGEMTYSALAAVCYNWWQTMNGWPQSNTRHWFEHKLSRHIRHKFRPYFAFPRLVYYDMSLNKKVWGLAYVDEKLCVITDDAEEILVFDADYEQLPSIPLIEDDSDDEWNWDKKQWVWHGVVDMVACRESRALYLAENRGVRDCEWDRHVSQIMQVSVDSGAISRLDNKAEFTAKKLSIRSSRLLVTASTTLDESNKDTYYCSTLVLFGADHKERRRITLPNMKMIQHSAETSRETFIVCHSEAWGINVAISEVDQFGEVLRELVPSDSYTIGCPFYMCLDSDDMIMVADYFNDCVFLLKDSLEIEYLLVDKDHDLLVATPFRMCYVEEAGLLIVASIDDKPCVQYNRVRPAMKSRTEHQQLSQQLGIMRLGCR